MVKTMDIKIYLETIFKTKIELTRTNLGLTNDIYVTYINGIKCAIRVPKFDNANIVDGNHEIAALRLIRGTGLDVEEIFFDEKTRIRVTKWTEGVNFVEYPRNEALIKVAKLMKKLHNLKLKSKYNFNPSQLLDKYKNNIKNPLYDLHDYWYLKDEINLFKDDLILCHNDWVNGNVILSKDHDYLIDYEYAANNNPIFDVTSFITENNLNENDKEIFLNEYYDKQLTEKLREKITIFENFHNLLWLLWANMMYDSRNEEIYKEIAKTKYHALVRK